MRHLQKFVALTIDSKNTLTASVSPKKAIIGKYLLWEKQKKLPGVKGFTKNYIRLNTAEKFFRMRFDQAHEELRELQNSLYAPPNEIKKALIKTQKCTLNVAEYQWKQAQLLFKYRKEMNLTQEEVGVLKKRLKVLANHVKDVYNDIENTKNTDFTD
jgi:hypothetical protein